MRACRNRWIWLFIPVVLFGKVEEKDGKVVFTLNIRAQSVTVAGTFNQWNPQAQPLKEIKPGVWQVALSLPPGRYEYKFVVDGSRWLEDPDNPLKTPDPYGGFNSVLIVTGGKAFKNLEATPNGVVFRFMAPEAQQVYLAGTFNQWAPTALPMKRVKDHWEAVVPLNPGVYQYKFVINGTEWREDPLNPARVDDGYGGFNSVFVLTEDGKILQEVPKQGTSEKPIGPELPALGSPVYLAIVWHQHQPRYFKDPETGEYEEPWVRLHAIKDYYDMAAILQQYPQVHVTINLTPVLLMQLEDLIQRYEAGKSPDRYVRLTLKDAASLTDEDKAFLLEHFFSANWDNMIDIWPRYRELRLKRIMRSDGSVDVQASIPRFTTQDWRDLQMWFNLAWFDPDFQEGPVVLPTGDTVTVQPWIEKGRDFSEEDKRAVIDLQFKILKAVVPIHRELQEKGQIEVITTPFYHPILPLIYDTDLAKEAMPLTPLPPRFHYPQDAAWHVQKAVQFYQKRFARPPKGLWPAEGAVADAVVDLFREAGVRWIASDVQVLARSLGQTMVSMSQRYRPYRVIGQKDTVFMVFRDTDLSDRIGFRYKSMDPVAAANDFVQALYAIHKALANQPIPPLVTVILDGENAWEWYPHDAKEFFHAFYRQLQETPWIRTVTVSEYLEQYPPSATIDHLFAGSWISADFSTWIGEREENRAWEILGRVRRDLDQFLAQDDLTPPQVESARLAMMAAEGSDWFWWFGNDQTSPGGDIRFDDMFRKTLKTVYTALGKTPPAVLDSPIVGGSFPTTTGGVMAPGQKRPAWSDLPKILEISDPVGDDHGPGTYQYPTDPVFTPGIFDLTKFALYRGTDADYWVLTFQDLPNPWNAPLGFSHPLIWVYVHQPGAPKQRTDAGSPALGGLHFDPSTPWSARLKIAGWPEYGLEYMDASGRVQAGAFKAWAEGNHVVVEVPHSLLQLKSGDALTILVCSQDGYAEDQVRPLDPQPGQWTLGGRKSPQDPPVMDLLDPSDASVSQSQLLSPPYTLVPSVRIP